ncbi:MAG: hypothetical protein ACOZNI_09715 [Myxococcota bacterium]
MDGAPFAEEQPDPRRGFLWPGAAPMEAGSGRVSVGALGGWLLLEPFFVDVPVPLAGAAAELSAAWAPTERLAFTAAGGAGALTTGDVGVAGLATARLVAFDGERLRVAPWVAGGLAGEPFATGGVALETAFYDVAIDVSVPFGGAAFGDDVSFVPTMLLAEAGFTWRLGEHTRFRLGYVAAAASWSWRWRKGPLSVELGGYTNVVSGNLTGRVGVVF